MSTQTLSKKKGRPRKDCRQTDYNAIDTLLVLGEFRTSENDGEPRVFYPSQREIARRFGISHTQLSVYAKKHNCTQRRHFARQRLLAKTEEKLLELRAQAMAFSKEDALATIDHYLINFRKAVAEDRVRTDSPSDFNLMLRLKEFLAGGPDSRQEIHTSLSLETVQQRHREMLATIEGTSEAEMGCLNGSIKLITLEKHPSTPPPTPSTNDPQKMTGNLQNSDFNELSDIEDQSEEASDSALQEES